MTHPIDLDHDPQRSTSARTSALRRLARPESRRTIATAGLAAIATLLVTNTIGGPRVTPSPPATTPAVTAPAAQPLAPQPRLIVPALAAPGERVTVLAFRNARLCGPADLRFDGAPVPHGVLRYASPDSAPYPRFFMSLDVPPGAGPGMHSIELIGPVQAAGGSSCGDVPERQGRIAQAPILVDGAARGSGPR
jgi:hypothetical protein